MSNIIGQRTLENADPHRPLIYLGIRDPRTAKMTFGITHPLQVEGDESIEHVAGTVGYSWIPDLLPWVDNGLLHYQIANQARPFPAALSPARVHIIGLGDVGAHCALGLRLLGEDFLTLGVYARQYDAARAFAMELSHIRSANDELFPPVHAVAEEDLYNCDLLVFAASAGVPKTLEPGQDVRMMQYEKNKGILHGYLEGIKSAEFQGRLLVLSDPVDALCNYAAKELSGVLPRERILGLGLGVMHARAAAYAQVYAPEYPSEGRAYGPHGHGLWIANSLTAYDDAVSEQLTQLTKEANLAIRALGAKPFYGPALSSGALSIRSLLKGEWFYGAASLSDIYFGSRIRIANDILYVERMQVPSALQNRLTETLQILRDVTP